MLKQCSLKTNFRKGWLIMFLFLIGAGLFSYGLYGPYYSPDTVNYFDYSQNLFNNSFWKSVYSPFYPLLLRCLSNLESLSLFQAANLIVLVQYGFSLCFLYLWTKATAAHYRIGREKRHIFLGLVFISFHSWWSFRIVTWAHADAGLYCFLIIWLYYLSLFQIRRDFSHLLVLSLLSAAMIWVKLNVLAFVPFYFLLLLIDKKKLPWLVPLSTTLGSYMGYRYWSRQNAFGEGISVEDKTLLFSAESWGILITNLSEFFKSSLGFILSDVLTSLVPDPIALVGGVVLILCLVILLVIELKKGISLSLLLLLFASVYLACQMAFQQWIGFEEINYRTLFPYFLGFSWYVWLKVARLSTKRNLSAIILSLLMVLHTLTGHVWLWKRKEVNSLFEVERLEHGNMMKKIQSLRQGFSRGVLFVSDRPEKLALLLKDPYVAHYHPEFAFIHGKRRPVADQEKLTNRAILEKKLLNGGVVVVIFGEDERLVSFALENGLLISKYSEGTVMYPQPTEESRFNIDENLLKRR